MANRLLIRDTRHSSREATRCRLTNLAALALYLTTLVSSQPNARDTDLYRQRGKIAAQVLRGTKPADIPVQQPDRFELVLNLRAAKAIGIEVPATLVARANKLIE